MKSRREPSAAASVLLIFFLNVFSGNTLTCHPEAEYQIGAECCPLCPAGKRVKTDCTEFRSTSCVPCVNRTSFMTQPNGLRECFPCASCGSGSGLKIHSWCTTTSDTVCEPLEGFFCIDGTGSRCVEAKRHRRCQPGQYINRTGTALTDAECSDCSDGTFSNGTSTSCQPHSQCELLILRPGTASTDAECGEDPISSKGAIVAVILAVIFLVVVVFFFVFYLSWRKQKRRLPGNEGDAATTLPERNAAVGDGENLLVTTEGTVAV